MTRTKLGHRTRYSDASTFDEVCIYCGMTDAVPGKGPVDLYECPATPEHKDLVDAGKEKSR